MQVRNNKVGNLQLHYSAGKDKVEYVAIPGEATVIIEDDIYAKLLKTKTTVTVRRRVETEIESGSENDTLIDKKKAIEVSFEETGETKSISLIETLFEDGTLTMVERPKVAMEIIEALLAENKVNFKDLSDEDKAALYNKLV